MEFKDRLQHMMEKRSIANAAELSRLTGLTQVAIRNYMRGIKSPNFQALKKLAHTLDTTADYLLSGTPSRPNRIPLLYEIPGGIPQDNSDGDYPAGFADEYVDRGDITDPNAFALVVKGDSMSPRIKSGDIVIISPNSEIHTRNIAAVSIRDGEKTLKRIIRLDPGKILLQPENERYEPVVLDEWEVTFIGRVVERRERL